MDTMHAPVFVGDGKIIYKNLPVPKVEKKNDVLIKIEQCGICGTDLNILAVPPAHNAKKNIVIGHEIVGKVIKVGSEVTQIKPEDRVVVAPRMTCGECYYCRQGLDNQCINYKTIGTTVNGGFAPYLCAPKNVFYKLSGQVDNDNAVLFEPLSCVVGAMAKVPMQAGDSVAIFGAGPMGALFAMVCKIMGAGKIIMMDISQNRLDFLQERNISTDFVNVKDPNWKNKLTELFPLGLDIVIDAVGNQINNCVQISRRGGMVILFGLRANENQTINQYEITRKDIRIMGSFVGLNPFEQTIKLLNSNIYDFSALITHKLKITELEKGVELMRTGTAMKVVVEMGEGK
jgi:threonine dehydrogenase-like Zn-dependent dehydrogenase